AIVAAADGPDADPRYAELDLVRVRHAGRLLAADARAATRRRHADPVDKRQALRDVSGGRRRRARRRLGIHGARLCADADPADRGPARRDQAIVRRDREIHRQSAALIEKSTAKRRTGGLAPGRGQTFDTLDYVSECGLTWFGDWILDDQPLWVKTKHGPILAVPYSAEINDITLMVSHHHESDVLLTRSIDAFDRLYAESADSARVMAIGVHPYVTGAAHRIKYFEQLYDYINR